MTDHNDDELLTLLDDDVDSAVESADASWKILIVDDDEDVHQATKFAMANTQVLERNLQFLHAYSAAEAVQVLQSEKDIAVILLDVVMESEDAGLKLVATIRKDLAISESRIILRTGQPGYAPEIDAIRDYDINDYKTKSELTRNKLYASLTSAIRSYKQIHTINVSRRGLDMVIRASGQLMVRQGVREFAAGVITQISALLGLAPEGVVCASDQGHFNGEPRIIAAAGTLTSLMEQPLASLSNNAIANALGRSLRERRNHFDNHSTTLFFSGQSQYDIAAHIETGHVLSDLDRQLLGVFCANISLTLDNVMLLSQLKDHAYNDQLLHIPNRLAFIQAVDRMISAQRNSEQVALIDIDNFSELNAAMGHRHGDNLLKAVAARLSENLPPDCLIARVGGDVFGVLGPENHLAPINLAEVFASPFMIDEVEHSISATTGITCLSEIDGNGASAIEAAAIALNQAKQRGRGGLCRFARDMEQETRVRVRLLQELRRATELNQLFMVYQPQLNLATRQIVGVEALLRWRNSAGQLVSPADFIPLAENSGLITSIGDWVLNQACQDWQRLQALGAPPVRMAVNVSVVQLRQPDFIKRVDAAIAKSGITPTQLELEVTESMAMLDTSVIVELLDNFKQRGICLAIDDFGTGFSSLSYLEKLSVDRLKIDRSFISNMHHSDGSMRIVETVVQLGRSLQLEVIAEGVEQELEAAALLSMGCHEVQGFLFSKPLEFDDLLAFLGITK